MSWERGGGLEVKIENIFKKYPVGSMPVGGGGGGWGARGQNLGLAFIS